MSKETVEVFANNPEPRCPVVLLLDTSSSMDGEPIEQLNNGVQTFIEEVGSDSKASLRVEVAIVTFNSSVQVEQDFVTIDKFIAKRLTATGSTSLGKGLTKSLEIIEKRKSEYREQLIPNYLPWLFLITDGVPTDDWETSSREVQIAVEERKLSFFVVGVDDADMKVLSKIASSKRRPVMLNGLLFKELFRWISASLMQVSNTKIGASEVNLSDISAWAKVDT